MKSLCKLLTLSPVIFLGLIGNRPVAAQAVTEVKIACVDGIQKADASKQASMVVGTVVGFVVGGVVGDGEPTVVITGTYVGCEFGKVFGEAFKTDQDKAMVLLNPMMYAFVKTNAGSTVIVFAGKMAAQAQQEARKAAEQAAHISNPAEAAIKAIVTPDGIVNPIGTVTAATLASRGVDPGTAATVGIILNPAGAVATAVLNQASQATMRGGRGCFGLC